MCTYILLERQTYFNVRPTRFHDTKQMSMLEVKSFVNWLKFTKIREKWNKKTYYRFSFVSDQMKIFQHILQHIDFVHE